MKTLKRLALTATILAAGQTFAAQVVPVLSFPDVPGTYETYGDFRSYSMPILDYFSGGQYMFNTANTIQGALVVGTGAGGNQSNTDLNLPGQVSNGFDFTNKTGDYSYVNWSINLTALRQFLTFDGVQHDLIGYFNNNQNNATANNAADDGTLANNLWAWAQVTLTGSNLTEDFYLNDAGSGSRNLFGHGDYVLSGGPVTLCFTNASLTVEQDCSVGNTYTKTFQHNLGQNDVSYAIFSEGLNDLLWNTDYTSMTVRVDFLDLNNGFENLFFAAGCVNGCRTTDVPEPGTVALLGLALAGLGFMRYRKS